jgi:hypothetical protein
MFEKTQRRTSFILGILIAGAAFAVGIWKCFYGVELYNEACYITRAFKLFGLGDRPFADEILYGLRHQDLLNYAFVRPFLAYRLLDLRIASFTLYAAILGWFTFLCFEKKWTLTAGLTFLAFLLANVFATSSWSYNEWVRNFLLLHHGLLILAQRRPHRLWLFLAGAAMGIVVISYFTLLPVFLVVMALLVFFPEQSLPQSARYYGLGAACFLLPDLGYLISSQVYPDWVNSFRWMGELSRELSNPSLDKAIHLGGYLFTRTELWLIAAAVFLSGRPGNRGAKGLLILAITARFLYKADLSLTHLNQWTAGTAIALGAMGALALIPSAWRSRQIYLGAMIGSSLLAALGMGMSSLGANGALIWVAPTIAIPFLATFLKRATATEPRLLFLSPLTVLVLWLGAGALMYQFKFSYGDLPPAALTQKLTTPPLQGIYTSPGRARLLSTLADLLKDKKFPFTLGPMPFVYYFGNTRPALNSIHVLTTSATRDLEREELTRMVELKRTPDLILRIKANAWGWGSGPIVDFGLPPGDPYDQFARCARGKTILDIPEFEAYEVMASAVESCAKNLSAKSLTQLIE